MKSDYNPISWIFFTIRSPSLCLTAVIQLSFAPSEIQARIAFILSAVSE
jgi:hypothetical protein